VFSEIRPYIHASVTNHITAPDDQLHRYDSLTQASWHDTFQTVLLAPPCQEGRGPASQACRHTARQRLLQRCQIQETAVASKTTTKT